MKKITGTIALLVCLIGFKCGWGQNTLAFGTALGAEEGRRIIQTPDSNFLIVGYCTPSGMGRDGLVLKMTPNGTILWAKAYGGTNWEEFYDVVYAGGYYYCVGYTRTWVKGTYGSPNLNADIFLVKLNLDGSLVWAKNMGRPSAGSSPTDGNDLGLRMVAAAQSGVVIVARINHGASSGQKNGLIWVAPDAKTRWAYQYDWTSGLSMNEITFGIWKDKSQGYITGGQMNTLISNDGFLMKTDQNGNVQWAQKTKCSPGIIESQYTGYYNHLNGKIYTADYYNKSDESIYEAVVITNMAETGAVPSGGGVPRAVSLHYGASGSSGNNYRCRIFPVGDGYGDFVLAVNDQSTSSPNAATIVAMDMDMNFKWSKNIGYPNQGHNILDMVTCYGTTYDLYFTGFIGESRDVLLGWTTYSDTSSCAVSDDIDTTYLSTTNTSLTINKVNLNTYGCTNDCWAGNDTIGDITISNYVGFESVACYESGPPPDTAEQALNFIETNFCDDPSCLTNLSFNFPKQPQIVYFEITDITENFVYERFYGQVAKLTNGFNFDSIGLKKGQYKWGLFATYSDKTGMEQKYGTFIVK